MTTTSKVWTGVPRGTAMIFLLLCFTWGTTWLAIRVGVSQVPPLWFASTRFVVAGLLLLGWAWGAGQWQRPTARQLRALLLMGTLCIAVCFGLIFWGEQYVESGIAGVVVQGFVPIGLLGFSALLGRDWVGFRAWTAVAVGVAGVILISWDSLGRPLGQAVLLGLAAIVLGTLFYDLGSILGRTVLSELSAVTASGWENFIGGLLLLPVSLAVERHDIMHDGWWQTGSAWAAWIYLVVLGSLVGFTCYTYLLVQWGPVRTSTYAFITPVIAMVVGWLIGNERFTAAVIFGAVLIVVAVGILWSDKRRAANS
jgi:drug/metabolite transporter (DMT)-like permease